MNYGLISRCFVGAALTVSWVMLTLVAEAQTPVEHASTTGASHRDRPVSLGVGAGVGPGYLGYGSTAGWYTRVFGAARLRLSRRWSAWLEGGVEYARSSVEGRFSGDNLLPDEGGISLGSASAPLNQEFRATAFLFHGMIGYDFGSVFGLRAGPLVGYASGTLRTDNCGDATNRGIAAGGALVPTFYLWRGLELRTQAEVAFMPLPVCTEPKSTSNWVEWRAPEVTQSSEPAASVMLTLAYVGF